MPTFEQSRSYNIAFVLDEPLLRACEQLIMANIQATSPQLASGAAMQYNVQLGANNRFSSDGVTDIIELANSGKYAIRSLLISTALFQAPSVSIQFRISEYGNTVTYTVRGDDQQKVFFLANQLEDFVTRSRCWYTRLAFVDATMVLFMTFFVLFVAGTVGFAIYVVASGSLAAAGGTNQASSTSTALTTGVGIASALLLALLGGALNRLRKWLFPSGIFAVGDGVRTVGRLQFWRSVIGVSILLAAAINIVTSFIL